MKQKISKLKDKALKLLKKAGEITSDLALVNEWDLKFTTRSGFYYAMKGLEKSGAVQKRKTHQNVLAFSLTPKGKRLLNGPKKLIKRTDGLSTLILFDVPTEKSRQRTIFRRYLVRNGYTLIQKSTLVSPYAVTGELRNLIKELNIEKYVKIAAGKFEY
jgi:DNA-binding transcriptional regulator PaaX